MKQILFTFVVVAFGFNDAIEGGSLAFLKESSLCGSWTPYKNEKCLKIVLTAGHQTQEDAEIVCKAFSEDLNNDSYPRLVTIKTEDEQKFLEYFLFVENKIFNNVWVGLKQIGNSEIFEWNDGSPGLFTNWANQTVTDDQHRCVEMESGQETNAMGLWSRVGCKKENIVVCERTPRWNLETLQNAFLNSRLELELQKKETASLKEAMSNVMQTLDEVLLLKQIPVPIGFIYVQLPGQDTPTILWPKTNWTEVSSSYAGLFFRVVGGQAAPFEQMQEGNTTRLAGVKYVDEDGSLSEITVLTDGSWSPGVTTSKYQSSGSDWVHLKFRMTPSEVRPRNQAVKLWKRIQ